MNLLNEKEKKIQEDEFNLEQWKLVETQKIESERLNAKK